MRRKSSTSTLAMLVVCAAAIAGSLAAVGTTAGRIAAAPPPGPIATGHSQVVAQGVVTLGDGPYDWDVTNHTVGASDVTVEVETATFVLAWTGPPVYAGAPDDVQVRLAQGEAMFAGTGALYVSNGARRGRFHSRRDRDRGVHRRRRRGDAMGG